MHSESSGLGFVEKNLAHCVGGASCRCFVVMGVPLQGESGGSVSGECLEVADGLAALGEQAQAGVSQVVEADRGETSPLK